MGCDYYILKVLQVFYQHKCDGHLKCAEVYIRTE